LPSNSKLKQYQQLHSKKFRQKYGLFVVEGLKSVNEIANSNWQVETILCTKEFLAKHTEVLHFQYEIIEAPVFYKISTLKNPQEILAIAKIQQPQIVENDWSIALDGINDPGNLGTIIRIADWYGISTIYCSPNSVDVFNPKVIQATMGSFLRVLVIETDLVEALRNKTVFATLLNGENIRNLQNPTGGVILIGNEANGINGNLLKQVPHKAITIPRIGNAESLNAGIATAICCERLIG
jgi:TrmH family RNA methyltransferase